MPTVADLVMERLADAGVTHCFVLPGGGAMHLVDALARSERVEPFPMLHEQAVGVAAEAYAQYTNGLGAALVTTGPGGTNAVTAVAAAWLDSTPCVFISGQVKTADLSGERGVRQFGFQEIDIVSVVKPITKHAVMITSADDAVAQVDEALSIARSGRPGPVWIDIPLDVQAQQVDWPPDEHEPPAVPDTQSKPAPKAHDVEAVVQALREAKRPLVLLGNGVRLAGATELAVDLFSRLGVPMALTWKALDFLPYDHPLNAGRPGSIATYASNFAIQGADVVLAIGARLDLGQLGYRHDTFVPEGRIFVVDVDPAEVGKFEFASPFLGIEADAGAFLEALDRVLVELGVFDTQPWISQIRHWQRDLPPLGEDDRDWDDGISQYTLISELSAQMTTNHLLVPGSSGACSEVVMQAFQNKAGQRVFNTEGLGPMGFGIPAAIGACVASGGRPVVSVDGDGGFAMNVQELATIAHRGLPISFFVLDNGGYGSIRTTSNNYFNGRRVGCDAESGLAIPDYVAVGEAFGIASRRIEGLSELHDAVKDALTSSAPSISVVRIGQESFTHPRLASRRLEDGRMETAPLHEMMPRPI